GGPGPARPRGCLPTRSAPGAAGARPRGAGGAGGGTGPAGHARWRAGAARARVRGSAAPCARRRVRIAGRRPTRRRGSAGGARRGAALGGETTAPGARRPQPTRPDPGEGHATPPPLRYTLPCVVTEGRRRGGTREG